MSSLNEQDVEENENWEADSSELYGVRDGTLFLIDGTAAMFRIDPQERIPYFLRCVRRYKEILKQKLVWNRQDWMGLIFFGTEQWDTDCEMKHISSVHKLGVVSVDYLKEAIKIDEGRKWERYRDIASSVAYPLHDALWLAARAFSAIDVTMPMRRVILFTCHDNPPITDDHEKHRIRVRASGYSDLGIRLFVVGLGETWNHDIFYKDLEMLSAKIEADDYQRTSFKDLVEQVKLPSRIMAKFPWRIGENVCIDVCVRSLSVKTQPLKKEYMSKETNAPLTKSTYYIVPKEQGEEEAMDDEKDEPPSFVHDTNIEKCQTFGGKEIRLKLPEVRRFCATREPGIDLICIKPISYHLLYHFEVPYFVTPNKSNRKDNASLFAALLDKCDSRKLMIICAITIRKHSASGLYTMIANSKCGGFYLYKVPFRENVRKINEYFRCYVFDDNKNKVPGHPNGIQLLEKIMEKLNIEYHPKMFSNPKLQMQLQTVETLSLNLEQREPPPDDTLPKNELMRELARDLLEKYEEIFLQETENVGDTKPKKRSKKVNEGTEAAVFESEEGIQELVMEQRIENCTVQHLKAALKTLRLKTSGKKDELIDRIKEYFK